MSRFQDLGLLLMRLALAAFMVAGHGLGKFNELMSGEPIDFSDPIGLGSDVSFYLVTFAEFACAILVGVGLLTRMALVPLIIAMSVAAFVAHADDPFGRKEKPLMYLAAWVGLFFTGPGRFTLQNLLARGREPQNPAVRFLTR